MFNYTNLVCNQLTFPQAFSELPEFVVAAAVGLAGLAGLVAVEQDAAAAEYYQLEQLTAPGYYY